MRASPRLFPMDAPQNRDTPGRSLQIHAAFCAGDLEALRAALGPYEAVPNGPMPDTIGSCLVYAIYHSPLPFIRTLLELGADPNAPVDDGFPPLIAALTCARPSAGAPARIDVIDILRLLVANGVDPNQRGLNDYTALHMAVAERQALAVQVLLDAGADPDLRTRIDECETPLDMARAAGLADIADRLARKGQPIRRRLRTGLVLLEDVPGTGEPVRRRQRYRIRLKVWLHHGEPVRWSSPSGPVGIAKLEDGGTTLVTETRVHRADLINGIFYGIDGMHVGGMRRLEIAPHLAYGERGVPGVIPPHALLKAEVTIVASAPLGPPTPTDPHG